MRNFDYVMPRTAEEACAAAAKPNAVLKAAGIDLLERIKEGIARPEALVNLLAVKGMAGITNDGGTIRIGALTTLAAIQEDAALVASVRSLCEAAEEAATPQVRNRATLGGNLAQRPRCWYFRNETYACAKKGGATCYALEGENKYHAIFDNAKCCIVHPSNLAPPLWTLDATVHVAGAVDPKTADLDIARFFVAPAADVTRENVLRPGDVITGVSFKAPPKGTGTAYLETREKESFDWALTSCACLLTIEGGVVKNARVVVSGVAPTPMRLADVEAAVTGKAVTPEVARAAGRNATAGATPLRDNAYKVAHLAVCVERALTTAARRAKGEAK